MKSESLSNGEVNNNNTYIHTHINIFISKVISKNPTGNGRNVDITKDHS